MCVMGVDQGINTRCVCVCGRNNIYICMCEGVCVWGGDGNKKDINMWV